MTNGRPIVGRSFCFVLDKNRTTTINPAQISPDALANIGILFQKCGILGHFLANNFVMSNIKCTFVP